jgi:hypothetical protein
MPSLISEEVEVRFEERPGPPTSFVWRGTEYRIVEVLQEHTVLDRQAAWWKRRHRTHYTVRTESGERFKLYYHRGYGRRYWMLFEKLDADGGADP